jgi:hypothetical protein
MGQSLVELLRKRDELLEQIAAAEAGVDDHKVSPKELTMWREQADRLSWELKHLGHADRDWN